MSIVPTLTVPGTPVPPTVPGAGKRITLVGDSITFEYGPVFKRLNPDADVVMIGGPSQDPATFPWAKALKADTRTRKPQVIILQDWAYLPYHPQVPLLTWCYAWANLVAVAKSSGAKVVIVVAPSKAAYIQPSYLAFLRAMPAQHLTAPFPDNPDGIHYLENGKTELAWKVTQVVK